MGTSCRTWIRALKFGCSCLFLSAVIELHAQDNVLVYGQVKDVETGSALTHFQVEVVQVGDTMVVQRIGSDARGRYQVELHYDTRVWLKFYRPGYVSKFVEFDLRGVYEEERRGGHGMELVLGLLERLDGLGYTAIEQEPFAVIHFNQGSYLTPDMERTERSRKAQERLVELQAAKRKTLADEAR
jgi:hypothetical protein